MEDKENREVESNKPLRPWKKPEIREEDYSVTGSGGAPVSLDGAGYS